MDLQSAGDKIEWRIGDITMRVLDFCRENFPNIPTMQVYSAVGAFAGRAARTVREYHDISIFYSLAMRQRFELLSFDHFRTALYLRQYDPIVVLSWAEEQVDVLGRPATVDSMEAHFRAEGTASSGEQDQEEPLFMRVARAIQRVESFRKGLEDVDTVLTLADQNEVKKHVDRIHEIILAYFKTGEG